MKDLQVEADMSILVSVPRVPNFLKAESGMVPLDSFSDDTLRVIGAQWTLNLIERAKQQRSNREKLA